MDNQTEAMTFSAERRVVILVHGAIAGASLAASLELASRETLSPLLLTALGCFAVAVPASIALVVLSQVIYELGKASLPDAKFGNQNWPDLSVVLAVVDQIACYAGFLLIFWSFHWIIGMIFLVATIVAFATLWMEEKNLRSTKKIIKESLENV
jgi:hypothetical protein